MEKMRMAKRSRSRSPCVSISIVCALRLFLLAGLCHGLHLRQTAVPKKHTSNDLTILGSDVDGRDCATNCVRCTARRNTVRQLLFGAAVASSPALSSASTTATTTAATAIRNNDSVVRHPFVYTESWTGTRIPIVSLEDATKNRSAPAATSDKYWTMGKWPDPALRIPATPVDPSMWSPSSASSAAASLSKQQQQQQQQQPQQILQLAAAILRDTARREGAVGLAAQQCGVDARMVFLSSSGGTNKSNSNDWCDDMVLVNPRIVARSPESKMKVWTEECLVLPPTFRATVLRDDWIDVEYDVSYEYPSPASSSSRESVFVTTTTTTTTTPLRRRFANEQSRCLQHELDHDRGILITDHVGLEELENDVMRRIEAGDHDRRQAMAYSRQ